MSQSEFITKANLIHENKYSYEDIHYVNIRTKVLIRCPKHGIFKQLPSNHLSGSGCPKCKRSKGEETISKYLHNKSIKFEEQYIIPYEDNKILVDFYLPTFNTFIEYNGRQHYIAMDYFGGELKFQKQIHRDNFLRNYCKDNNIKLIEIRYDENVSNKLKYELGI